MARKQLLEREDGPRLWAVIDEAVLRRPIGGYAVLREQIESLLGYGNTPNVRLQVMPFDFLKRADASQVVTFIQNEHPQTIALILAYLQPTQAAAIISSLPRWEHLARASLTGPTTCQSGPCTGCSTPTLAAWL